MAFEKIIDGILAVEQGYVDHPNDKGGPTNFGITLAVARANGYTGDMRSLPESFARKVYHKRYIIDPGFDKVSAVDMAVAEKLIDVGVNMDPATAGKFLQRALNALNTGGRYGAPLAMDGQVGPGTVKRLQDYIADRRSLGAVVLLRAINGLQTTRYIEIAENDPKQRDFTFGWISNRVA